MQHLHRPMLSRVNSIAKGPSTFFFLLCGLVRQPTEAHVRARLARLRAVLARGASSARGLGAAAPLVPPGRAVRAGAAFIDVIGLKRAPGTRRLTADLVLPGPAPVVAQSLSWECNVLRGNENSVHG